MNKFANFSFYVSALHNADWNYEFSDDHSYWKSARAKIAELYGASGLSEKHLKAWEAFSRCNMKTITMEVRDAIVNELLETENV